MAEKTLTIVNTIALLAIVVYLVASHAEKSKIPEEIKAQRLSIVGPDGHLYISMSNPEKQALATTHGVPNKPGTNRDLPGLLFFNRVGDEVGGIYYDGTDEENFAGITFDQQKNDQIMAIMKDEYLDEGEWKRWYGMFFRERVDSVRVEKLYDEFIVKTKGMDESEKNLEYQQFKKYLDSEINVYRMFLGREENKNTGLFIYDSKGRERIKLYVDETDTALFEILDKDGNEIRSGNVLDNNE